MTGWLEHLDTRLKIHPGEEHSRTPTLAAFHGSRASNRKSSMQKWFLEDLLGATGLPEGVKDSCCIATDGTIKGHRNNLWNYKRSGLSSTEISECYKTSLTDPAIPPSKLASKSLMNKFVHGERDASISGAMKDESVRYLFFHWVIGHTGPTCEVLSMRKGAEMGFPKRFHCVFKGCKPVTRPDQECAASKQLLRDFVSFLAVNVTKGDSDGEGTTVTCDKYAAGWLRPSVLTVRGCGECSGAVFVSEVASRTRHPCLLFQDFVPFFSTKLIFRGNRR